MQDTFNRLDDLLVVFDSEAERFRRVAGRFSDVVESVPDRRLVEPGAVRGVGRPRRRAPPRRVGAELLRPGGHRAPDVDLGRRRSGRGVGGSCATTCRPSSTIRRSPPPRSTSNLSAVTRWPPPSSSSSPATSSSTRGTWREPPVSTPRSIARCRPGCWTACWRWATCSSPAATTSRRSPVADDASVEDQADRRHRSRSVLDRREPRPGRNSAASCRIRGDVDSLCQCRVGTVPPARAQGEKP